VPKLNDEVAAKVEAAEDGFAPLDPGVYVFQLKEDVEIKEGPKGQYWKWTFEIPEGQPNAGRRVWTNTSLSEAAFFKLKEIFSAFGVPTSTDTAELVGEKIRVMVIQTTAQQGSRKGQIVNEFGKALPLEGDLPDDVQAQLAATPNMTKDAAPAAAESKPLF